QRLLDMRLAAADERPRTVAMDEHPLFDEPGDGAPQRRSGDLEHPRQLPLARQDVGPSEAPRGDLAFEGHADARKQRLAFGFDRAKRRHSLLRPPDASRQEVYTWPIMKHKRA